MVYKIITRKTSEDDLSGIINLHQDLMSYMPQLWKVYLEMEPDFGIVAEINGSMAGCVHVYPHRETGWVEGLYVHPGHRKEGVGKRLLEEAFSLITAEGGRFALIDALMDNVPAIRLYHKLGFKNVYVRSHLAAKVEAFSGIPYPGDSSFHNERDTSSLWSLIIDSDAYLARHGIIMGCHRGWKLGKEDLEDFEALVLGRKSVMVFREVTDLELAPNVHGLFEKQHSNSKHARRVRSRFEINLVSGDFTDSERMISHIMKRAEKAGSYLIDIWAWSEDPLSRLYNELGFENWGNLYLMQKEL